MGPSTGLLPAGYDGPGMNMGGEGFFDSIALTEVTLRVADLARAQAFYQDVLGFACQAGPAGTAALGPPDSASALVVLEAAPEAPPRARGTASLFHVAFLYPDRPSLARVLRRLTDLGAPIGSADHGVSEALYLSDPEGNGIELYVDRPRDAWPTADAEGQVSMFTEALDLPSLLAQARQPGPLLPPDTRIGHIHLSVADLGTAERFYADGLGFGVTQRDYPGALFMARDGYHHHIGANIWRSRQPARPGALGLSRFTVAFRRAGDFDAAVRAVGAARAAESDVAYAEAQDLDGIGLRLALAS
jgi:catechol 2,3-dioxygenase